MPETRSRCTTHHGKGTHGVVSLPRHRRVARVAATVAGSEFPDTAACSSSKSGPGVGESEGRAREGREGAGAGGRVGGGERQVASPRKRAG